MKFYFLLEDPGRVRSQIISVVCQIQWFDFDSNLVFTRKVIIRTDPPLRLTANKVTNGVESSRRAACHGKVHEILGSNILTVSLGIFPCWLYTQHIRVFLFYCFFFCIVYNAFDFSCVMNTFPKFENWTAVLDFCKTRQGIREIFFKFQMPITSSKIWFETRFVYDEYDRYCRQIRGTENTDARFDEARLRSSSAQ
jgi:hypothetical protein